MKLSELINDYIALKIEGEPRYSVFESINQRRMAREHYDKTLNNLEDKINEIEASVEGWRSRAREVEATLEAMTQSVQAELTEKEFHEFARQQVERKLRESK